MLENPVYPLLLIAKSHKRLNTAIVKMQAVRTISRKGVN